MTGNEEAPDPVEAPPLRKLIAALLSAAVAGQAAAFAGALVLGLHFGDHSHELSVAPESGHFHLVLSHEGADSARGSHDGGHTPALSESDHVFHLDGDAPVGATARRADAAPAPVPRTAGVFLPIPSSATAPHSPPEPRSRGVELQGTTVLRC